MEAIDIVRYAAFRAGVIPSFNPNDLPGDVLDAGIAALTEEILPTLNCDRTLDVAVTSRIYTPNAGVISLRPLSQPTDNFVVIGKSSCLANELLDSNGKNLGNTRFDDEVARLRPAWTTLKLDEPNAGAIVASNNWPVNDFGERCTAAIWSADLKLVYADDVHGVIPQIRTDVNIDFPPMRIDSILDVGARFELTYVYRDEFERVLGTPTPGGVYTVEETTNGLDILMKACEGPKIIVLPVPLQLINRDATHPGTIIAPAKFKRYLTDCVAVSLAITYGVSTVENMAKAQEVSYNLLKKNKPQPQHGPNVSQIICDTLRRPIGAYGRGVIVGGR